MTRLRMIFSNRGYNGHHRACEILLTLARIPDAIQGRMEHLRAEIASNAVQGAIDWALSSALYSLKCVTLLPLLF